MPLLCCDVGLVSELSLTAGCVLMDLASPAVSGTCVYANGLIASISVSAILVARNVITLYCINTRTLYHGPSTTDVPHTRALVARAKVKWHHTHISTGCSDVTMLRLFSFYTLRLRHIHVNTIHYVLNSQKCINIIMACWYEQVNNLNFGILQWQDTHADLMLAGLCIIIQSK